MLGEPSRGPCVAFNRTLVRRQTIISACSCCGSTRLVATSSSHTVPFGRCVHICHALDIDAEHINEAVSLALIERCGPGSRAQNTLGDKSMSVRVLTDQVAPRRWPHDYQRRLLASLAGILLVSGAVLTGPAQAAGVHAETGEIFINPGTGFFSVTKPTYVGPGTKIKIPAGATAYLAYENGCAQRIEGARTVEVLAVSPCESGQAQTTLDAGTPTTPSATGEASTFMSPPVLLGGLVIAGGVGAALALSGGSSGSSGDKPVSP